MAKLEALQMEQKDELLRALEKLGEGSVFLWTIFILTIVPPMFNGMHSMSYIFIAEVPNHWCTIPALVEANWTDEQIRNVSSATPCTMYNYSYEDFARIGFDEALHLKNSSSLPTTYKCSARTFAKETKDSSFVEDWDLVCDKMADRSNTQMSLSLGKMLGSMIFGIFSDKFGRKISYSIGILMLIVSGPASGLVPWYWCFMLLRLTTGMSHAAIQYSSFTILTEVASEKHRQWMGIAYNTGYPIGTAIIAGIAYAFHNWRHIQLASSLPALFLLLFMWLMPESPRWLISQGRRKEARKLIEKNYGPISKTPEKAPKVDNTPQRKRLQKSLKGFVVLVSNYELRRRLVIMNFAWLTASLSYYALALNVNNFSTNRYVYVLVMGITEIPAYLVPTPILMFVGRRQASTIIYCMAGICLLSILALPTSQTVVIIIIALIGRFALSAVYSIIILYTSELFPTVVRNSAVGASSAMSHVGSIAAPYVADLLGAAAWWAPTTLCGLLALLAGLSCAMLPETRGKPLAETVEEEVTSERGLVSFRNYCAS